MTYTSLGPDPVDQQVQETLGKLAGGEAPRDIERRQVDIKEEPGRRGPGGSISPGSSQNEAAAKYLAGELACFANSPGGGAIILGVADDGTHIGTNLDREWLRHRIWELTERALTARIDEGDLSGTRVLVLTTHQAIEPIRYEGRIKWRVDDNCVEVDPTTWHAGRIGRDGVDWSAQLSSHHIGDAKPEALLTARKYLLNAGDDASRSLESASDADLLRRLNLVGEEDRLTNAGSLLFVETPVMGLDYVRREVPGGDSLLRIRGDGPLLVQISEVEKACQSANRVIHLPDGFAHGQINAIPQRAIREAIVNGTIHRDWLSEQPTLIEHFGDTLVVTSPGGFVGGVSLNNIITHPSSPRYKSLAEAVSRLRLAEREGIGIDRMMRDMLVLGRPAPEITELPGPMIRVGLLGGNPNEEVVTLLNAIAPATVRENVDALIIISALIERGWIDVERAAPLVQRPPGETTQSLEFLSSCRIDGDPVIVPVDGQRNNHFTMYRLSHTVRARLSERWSALRSVSGRSALILDIAGQRGQVTTPMIKDLTGMSQPTVTGDFNRLIAEGKVKPGRQSGLGPGLFYVLADS